MNIQEMILYEDQSILVVHKPAGLAVETKNVTEVDLESRLRTYLVESSAGKARPQSTLYTVHRLDQRVEGVMVFAKTKGAAADLSGQIQEGIFRKIYRAKVEGRIPCESETLVHYLQKDTKARMARIVEEQNAQGGKGKNSPKRAVLTYRKLADDLVEVEL